MAEMAGFEPAGAACSGTPLRFRTPALLTAQPHLHASLRDRLGAATFPFHGSLGSDPSYQSSPRTAVGTAGALGPSGHGYSPPLALNRAGFGAGPGGLGDVVRQLLGWPGTKHRGSSAPGVWHTWLRPSGDGICRTASGGTTIHSPSTRARQRPASST